MQNLTLLRFNLGSHFPQSSYLTPQNLFFFLMNNFQERKSFNAKLYILLCRCKDEFKTWYLISIIFRQESKGSHGMYVKNLLKHLLIWFEVGGSLFHPAPMGGKTYQLVPIKRAEPPYSQFHMNPYSFSKIHQYDSRTISNINGLWLYF